MDLLNLLIDLEKMESTCFLCYKQNRDDILSLYEDIEIQEKHSKFSITIWKIMKWLFPSYDILLNQVCNDCTDLIIKMYLTLKRSYLKRETLKKLIDNINTKVQAKTKSDVLNSEITIKLMEHNEISTDFVKTDKCKNCNMTFDSKEILQNHVKITHENANKAVICDKCGKEFQKPNALKMHLQCHDLKQCPFCFKMLKSLSHFRIHVRSHNSTTKKRQRKKNYYKCKDCSYTTVNKSTLESHINKIHLNIRPYVCSICSKGFFKKSNLTEHIQTHNNAKQNMCEVCGENFVNKKTLNEHLRLHIGQKPFKCDICDHTFVTHSRKNEHIKRKHMERNICCTICNKKYSLKKDLNSHMKRIHSQGTEMQCSQGIGSNIGQNYYFDNECFNQS